MEATEVIADHSLESLEATVHIVALIIYPENARLMVKNASIVTERDTLVSYVTQSNMEDHQDQV